MNTELENNNIIKNLDEQITAKAGNNKTSIISCVKSFWKPSNWFNYKTKVSREEFWKTILGNFVLVLAIVVGLDFFISEIFPNSSDKTIDTILSFSLLPLGVYMTLGNIALMMRRANSSGIKQLYIWLSFAAPNVISLIISSAALFYSILGNNINVLIALTTLGLFGKTISTASFLINGLLPNKNNNDEERLDFFK